MDEEVERVFQETADHYERKMEHMAKENHELKKQLTKRNKDVKRLQRILSKKKKHDRQHYKNGKRGLQKGNRV